MQPRQREGDIAESVGGQGFSDMSGKFLIAGESRFKPQLNFCPIRKLVNLPVYMPRETKVRFGRYGMEIFDFVRSLSEDGKRHKRVARAGNRNFTRCVKPFHQSRHEPVVSQFCREQVSKLPGRICNSRNLTGSSSAAAAYRSINLRPSIPNNLPPLRNLALHIRSQMLGR